MPPRLGRVTTLAFALVAVGGLVTAGVRRQIVPPAPVRPTHPAPRGAARLWAVDDGTRVVGSDGAVPAMEGRHNPVWSPGEPVRLFGLPGETLAVQVVVTAGDTPLDGVTVRTARFRGPMEGGPRIAPFVVYELPVWRRSGGDDPRASLGWTARAQPPGPPPGGRLPDPLVPLELADHPAASKGPAPWDYPMTVPAHRHRVIWLDVALPESLPAGSYRGTIVARDPSRAIGRLTLELEVGETVLPYQAVDTMLYFEPETVSSRAGAEAIDPYLQLVHRHHLSTILVLQSPADIERYRAMLTGALFTERAGYRGPGAGVPTDVVAIGCYGVLGMPDPAELEAIDRMLAELEEMGTEPDVFLYAVDEHCDSPAGPAWRRALDASGSERLAELDVGHTCSRPPADQPVDLVMMHAPLYRPAHAQSGAKAGKTVWIYNGMLPRTGSFLTDGWPISTRANAWIQAHHDIDRWFYWESTYWDDDYHGGWGPYDPWDTAETFHNAHGDHCNGDGVLVYPGRQQAPGRLDLGLAGVLPSIRLKQWRRGIQDAGYLALAREREPAAAEAIAAELVGDAFEARTEPRFPTRSTPWREARRALFDLVER